MVASTDSESVYRGSIGTGEQCIRRFVNLKSLVVVLAMAAAPMRTISYAQELQEWNNPAGGSFGTSTNWQSSAIPVALDEVVFDVATALGGSPAVYAVTFGMDRMANSLEVSNDDVTLQLMDHTFQLADFIVVGLAGPAVLRLDDGSLTNAGAGIVGAPGSPSKAVVNGAGTNWTSSGNLLVGVSSTGTLDVLNGATVDGQGQVLIGNSPGGDGTANVDGNGSQLTIVDTLAIGNAGTGELNITDGGTVNNESMSGPTQTQIGAMDGMGTVNVTGLGSSLSVAGLLIVGKDGNGTLLVSNGATVSNTGQAQIASEATGTGNVTVTGMGSTWTSTDALFVDVSGTGRLTVSSGGSVASGADVNIGTSATSDGMATVIGSGSTLSSAATTRVGFSGVGQLDVHSGGKVMTTGQGILGLLENSQGTVNVDGDGSSWSIGDALVAGGNGTAAINVSNSGEVTVVGEAQIGIGSGSGNVYVDGAGSKLTVSNLLFVGADGAGTGNLSISDGGMVISEAAGFVGTFNENSGTVTVDGNDSHWQIANVLAVGNEGTGEITVSGGGQITNFGVAQLGVEIGSSGTATVDGGGSNWTSFDTLSVGGGDIAGGSGQLTVQNGGRLDVDGTLKVLGTGNVDLTGGAINVDTVDLSDGGGFEIVGGNLKANHIVGNFVFNGGTLSPGMDGVLASQTASGLVVPEPSTVIHAITGLLVLLNGWRRSC